MSRARDRRRTWSTRIEGRARAFVQVQNGCDHRCTFCIIPYRPRQFALRADGRGGRAGAAAGRQRLSRGRADRRRHHQLGRRPARRAEARPAGARRSCKQVPELQRLRLSSIDSVEADADLHATRSPTEERLMPHLHLSLQAGDDMILKRMKRRHLRADAIRFCEEVRGAAARHRLRRRPHRRLPDRDRGDVRELADDRRGMRPDASARLPVLAARGHAGRAHAAGRPRGRQGARRAAARGGRSGLSRGISRRSPARAQSILVERDGLGRTEGFTLAALDAGAPGEIVEADDHRP